MTEAIDKRYEWLLDLRKVSEPRSPSGDAGGGAAQEGHDPPQAEAGPAAKATGALEQLPVLKGLYPAQIRKILRICTVKSFQPGERICTVDSGCDEMYILIAGEVCARSRAGTEVVNITPITTVGELGFMTNHPRPTSLEALQKSRVICLQKGRFEQLLRSEVEIRIKVQQNTIDILSGKMVRLLEMVERALGGTG